MIYDAGGREDFILIGTIGRAHGLGGHVRVRPFTDDPERFYDLERVYLEDGKGFKPLEIDEADVYGETVTLRFTGIQDRTAAESLNGKTIYIRREDAVELPADTYFISDIIGCTVMDGEGKFLGKVSEVLQHGAADVYALHGGPNGDVMFPALKAVIAHTDIQGKKIIVHAERFKEVAVFED